MEGDTKLGITETWRLQGGWEARFVRSWRNDVFLVARRLVAQFSGPSCRLYDQSNVTLRARLGRPRRARGTNYPLG